MTLHEAIEIILQESGEAMTATVIADAVNQRKLYARKDGLPVSAAQIASRIENYRKIFIKENGRIKLVKDDVFSQSLFKLQNYIVQSVPKESIRRKGLSSEVLIDALESFLNNNAGDLDDHTLHEPNIRYGNIEKSNELKVVYELFRWFFLQEPSFTPVVSEGLSSFLAGLKWFNSGNHQIFASLEISAHFLLKIAYENPEASFPKIDINDGAGKKEDLFFLDSNPYVEQTILKFASKPIDTDLPTKSTGIFIPAIGNKSNGIIDLEVQLTDYINKQAPDRAVIIVPSSFFFSQSKTLKQFRKKLIKSGYIDTVVEISSGIFERLNLKANVLILDFSKRNEEIFFLDAASQDIVDSIRITNEKIVLRNTSIFIRAADIDTDDLDLTPAKYVFEPEIGQLKPGYSLYRIENLIRYKKQGTSIAKGAYSDGEVKVIRASDINFNERYLSPKTLTLGVDLDDAQRHSEYFVEGNIVLNALHKKLKANILPEGNTYFIGQDVFWIELNHEIILNEYFIRELDEKYVCDQVEKYSKGATIMRLPFKDFLQIQIRIPSLEAQKDLTLTEMQNAPIFRDAADNDEAQMDFINTLEHSLKQPASGLGNDLLSLRNFLTGKSNSGTPLNIDESVVPLFDTDTAEQIAIHSLSNTLDRMSRAVSDINYILEQARVLATLGAEPVMELIKLNPFLKNFIAENPDITISVSGKAEIFADKKQLRILFNNLIRNAKQHGFPQMENVPTIWLDITPKDELSIQISISNNGKSLPSKFTIEDFLAKGKSSKQDVGSGFGGFLIGQILKNHKGNIALREKFIYALPPRNVEFLITLPI